MSPKLEGRYTGAMDLSYPIGKYQPPEHITLDQVGKWTRDIAALPAQMRAATTGLSDTQLETPYREGGWTVRQTVHHVFDSHASGFIRLKLALTEDRPTIKPYNQEAFAGLPDSKLPIEISLSLLENLHARWVAVLGSLTEADLEKGYLHPEMGKFVSIGLFVGMYAHHGRNHAAQLSDLRERMAW